MRWKYYITELRKQNFSEIIDEITLRYFFHRIISSTNRFHSHIVKLVFLHSSPTKRKDTKRTNICMHVSYTTKQGKQLRSIKQDGLPGLVVCHSLSRISNFDSIVRPYFYLFFFFFYIRLVTKKIDLE